MGDASKRYLFPEQMCARIDELEEENDRLRDGLQRIKVWTEAYPVDIFEAPSKQWMQEVNDLMAANKKSMGMLTAHILRKVLPQGIGKIATETLEGKQ